MKKTLILSVFLIAIIAGCIQQQPTGKFLTNQTGTCETNWNCTDWSGCFRTGTETGIQNRTCLDSNNCNDSSNKPTESRICGLPKMASKEPEKMALEISDLLQDKNWTTREKNLRSREEVSQVERDLGFKNGYYINYFSQYGENNTDFIHVYHYVSVYPIVNSAINMSYSFDAAEENYKVGSSYESTNKKILSVSSLSDPFIGDFSIAYNVTVSDVTGFKESIYSICFTKWDVAEVITIEGSRNNYEILKNLAKLAENKIA